MAAQKRLVEYSDTDSEAEADAPAAPSKKKRNSYSIEMKIGALDMLRAGRSQRSVANYFRVDRDTIRDWKLREASLRADDKMRKKLPGAGRPFKVIKDMELDNKVHNLSYRQATATCQKTPADYEKDVVGFIRYVEQLREDEQFSHVYAADEAAVWLDMASDTCITDKGAQEVAALTTGHDKMRITVMLTARSDGYKYRPFVLLNRQRPVKEIVERFGQKLELCWRKTDWMTDECMQQYLETTFKKNPIVLVKRLLVWDAYRVHLTEATKGYLRSAGVHAAVIPRGCKKYLHAPDVCWNAPFKAKIRTAYEDWMLHGDRQHTADGNPKPPHMRVYLQWVCDAWDSLSREVIKESFKTCGLTTDTSGAEDHLIRCMEPDGPIPGGRKALKASRINDSTRTK